MLVTSTTNDLPLSNDLQDDQCNLDRVEQDALRMMMAMRVVRQFAGSHMGPETDVLVVEALLSKWWRAWADREGAVQHPFAVVISDTSIAAVAGLSAEAYAASLNRLTASGAVQIGKPPRVGSLRSAAFYQLDALFTPILLGLEPMLLRSFKEHHKADLVEVAAFAVESIGEDFEGVVEANYAPLKTPAFTADWAAFLDQHPIDDLGGWWERDPEAAYAWFSQALAFQDRLSVLQGRSMDGLNLHQEMERWDQARAAVLSNRYQPT